MTLLTFEVPVAETLVVETSLTSRSTSKSLLERSRGSSGFSCRGLLPSGERLIPAPGRNENERKGTIRKIYKVACGNAAKTAKFFDQKRYKLTHFHQVVITQKLHLHKARYLEH